MEKLTLFFGSTLSVLIVIYLLGRFYSELLQRQIPKILNLEEIRDNIRKSNGIWEFTIPFALVFGFIFNVIATGIWFIGEVIVWGLKLAKWLFTEFFIPGVWFLVRMAWHYIVIWPWTIIKIGFNQLKNGFNVGQYKVAVAGLFFTFLISFLGRFFATCFGYEWCIHVATVLSLFPIGICLTEIAWMHGNQGNEFNNSHRIKYLKHLGILIGFFGLLFVIEALLIKLGTTTNYSNAFSSLLIGGTLISSLFILFNAVLLLFIFSALPSFSPNYSGTLKEFPGALWNHIKSKGLQYLLTLLATLVPMIILAVIPYYLTSGIVNITQNTTNQIYDREINSAQKDSSVIDYNVWYNTDSISNQKLDELFAKDKVSFQNKRHIAILTSSKDYLNSVYSKHSDPILATPLFSLFAAYGKYNNLQSETVNINRPEQTIFFEQPLNNDKSNAEGIEKDVETILADKESYKSQVCNETSSPVVESQDAARAEAPAQEPANEDNCALAKKQVDKATLLLARSKKITSYHKDMIDYSKSINGAESNSNYLAWLFASMWISLLLALSFGFSLALFARTNQTIYSKDDGADEYVFVGEIKRMNAINSNQPLLALGILFGLIFLSLSSLGTFFDKIKDIFPNNVNPIVNSAPLSVDDSVYTDSIQVTSDTMAVALDTAAVDYPEYQEMPADTVYAAPQY
ncbi:MAG: hypothetical protein EXR18_02495 [Flavobacteriaceae bacterium]|nr:hypothetical protein [Flavobacteriaceae bacterium]